MGLQSFSIILDNPSGAYYAGQTVSGRAEIVVGSVKKVRSVSIAFKGEAYTGWSVRETRTADSNDERESETVDLSGSEEYFRIKYHLVGGSGGEVEIPPGQHVYPFTTILPPTLPSSFEGEFGHVRYTVKVTLDRPWKFDQEAKRAFTVLSPLDLNANARLKEPARLTMEKYFCCCWCRSGPLTCVVSLPCTGFVPGQAAPIVGEVDNISNVEVTRVNFKLKKVVSYHSQHPRRETKQEETVIDEFQSGHIAAHCSYTWNQPLVIPPLPPSNLTNCSLIDLDYELQVIVEVSGLHTNMETKIPITIGTTPLSVQSYESPSGGVNSNIGWITPQGDPSFTASQYAARTIKDKEDNQYTVYCNDGTDNSRNYSPMYPVFRFAAQ